MRYHYEPPNTEISDYNSTTNQLTESPYKFTGQWEEVLDFTTIQLIIHSNVSSIDTGIILQFSQNSTDIDFKFTDYYQGNSGYIKIYPIVARYFRFIYTSSGSTTNLRIQTLKTNMAVDVLGSDKHTNDISKNDAFGRLRISQPFTLFDSTNVNSKDNYLMDELIIGNGGATHNFSNSCVDLVVSNDGDRVLRQSHRYLKYQPGKSLFILTSGVLNVDNNNESNTTARIGYFNDDNGVFFQYDGINTSIGLRSNTTGTVTDTIINLSNCNIDNMDGSGKTGFNFDSSKTQIFAFDIEWLGVGSVRYGLVLDGGIHYVHKLNNANLKNNVFMSTANLPISYELKASGNSNTSGSMKEICSTVMSEGGYDPFGISMTISNNNIHSINNGVEKPLIVLKLKDLYKHNYINIINCSTYLTTNKDAGIMKLRVFRDIPNIDFLFNGGLIFSNVNNYSYLEANTNPGTYTSNLNIYNNIEHLQGFSINNTNNLLNHSNPVTITSNITGTTDIAVLSLLNISGQTDTCYGSVSWLEYR